MTPDTFLTLGAFEFSRFEIPEGIVFGGKQNLAIQELIGGKRIIDAMGRSDKPLAWSGLFEGSSALSRARYIDGLRVAGTAQQLSWSELKYMVVVEEFEADFQNYHHIPYHITLQVISDLALPVTSIMQTSVDESIRDDMTTASSYGDAISDGPLSGLLSTLDTAISNVSDFAKAAQSEINAVLVPLANVQARVGVLTASLGNMIGNVTTIGGVLPNNPIAKMASSLTGQLSAMTQLPQLYNLQSVLGRMGGNIGTIGGGSKVIPTGGGNLFSMAEKYYGDATEWSTLASANGVTDPQIQGLKNIVVPDNATESDGILNA